MIRQNLDLEDLLENLFVYGMEIILIVFVLWSAARLLFTSDASNTESTQLQQIEASQE